MMLKQLIAKSRADARLLGMKQLILVERHLAEREIGRAVCDNLLHYLRASGVLGGDNEVIELTATDTTLHAVVWEAEVSHEDAGQTSMFSNTRRYQFVTDFEGELVRIIRPLFREVRKVVRGAVLYRVEA